LREVEAKGLDAFGAAPAKVERVSRHFWFESYRWTVTPHGLVAVGGRNASQNDAVVKKYLRDGDRYVHAEIHGAPSVVVRPPEGPAAEVPNDDLRAACHFAVVSSRAWRQYGPATAYWVNASQVSKTPRSGEYVPKGAWIIHGKRNVEPDLPMRWWVGRVHLDADGRPLPKGQAGAAAKAFPKLVGGTLESLLPYADDILEMVPGAMDPADAAQALAERYGVGNEEAQAVLPAGPVQFVEART
ncbi:MAG TPA: NFACT RNA binding domain-containing protein, partial [Candidatus Thermoplasmatota archaeon]|nr:NFACT RNA binding domain-containing protein [Candidatus Thermoplasmatota archaeon]